MKKLIIVISLILSGLLITSGLTTYAATFVPEPSASVGGLWHVEDGNQAYVYMRYTMGGVVVDTGNYHEHYSTWWGGEERNFRFNNTATPQAATLANPDPLIYTKFRVQIIANINIISGGTPIVVDILNTENVNSIEVRLYDWATRPNPNYLYDYSFIELYVNGIKRLTSRNIDASVSAALGFPINPNYSDITFGVKMYWSKTTEEVIDPGNPEDPQNPWGALPITTGKPSTPLGVWGEVNTWNYNPTTKNFSFTVNYLETLYHVENLYVSGNTDFIAKTKKIVYFTDPVTNDRILYMNFSDEIESMILKTGNYENVQVWQGEALWNLTRNEVNVTNVMRVFNYVAAIESNGQVFSYFYMPDVPIDDLLSVTVNLGYRYHEKPWPWSSYQPGPIQSKTITLTKGVTSTVNPTWVEDVYRTSFWTAGIASAMMILNTPLGMVPKLGWGIAAGAFIVGGLFYFADEYEFFAYDIAQIQHVIPTQELRNSIDAYIQSKDPTASPINTVTNKLYKLNLGTLNDGSNPQVLDDYSNVTQIVWQTNGKVYSVSGDYIKDDWGGPGTEPPADVDWFKALDIPPWVLLVGGIILVLWIAPTVDKGASSLSNLFSNRRKAIIVIIIVLVVLILTGVIRI